MIITCAHIEALPRVSPDYLNKSSAVITDCIFPAYDVSSIPYVVINVECNACFVPVAF